MHGILIRKNKSIIVDQIKCLVEKHISSKCKIIKSKYPITPEKKDKDCIYVPTRTKQLCALKEEQFDVLIIGGGATGAGCALDAVTRGLKTALVDMNDFSSGTSSRSTKLIHGGVRYLEDAVKTLDRKKFRIVKEALRERAWMLKFAPYLTKVLPIIIPIKSYWKLPYIWLGLKMYDLTAMGYNIKKSYLISKKKTLEMFPMLKEDKVKCSLVYHDGQMDDARMNIGIIMTAAKYGAVVANHIKVLQLMYNECGKLCGAVVRDELRREQWFISAKCIINAAGPFTDSIRRMDNPNVKNICTGSSGVHIILPGYLCSSKMGLLDPATSDGRIIFLLPWQNHTLVGTTDLPCKITTSPKPTEEEIKFILDEIKPYFKPEAKLCRTDVLSAWSGIRPLVFDLNKKDTKSLARNHVIQISPSNLVTIAGGKWTTFRAMAEQTVNAAVKTCSLRPSNRCITKRLKIDGTDNWSPTMYLRLVQNYGIAPDVALHLSETYGYNAYKVLRMAQPTGKRWPVLGKKLHEAFPHIEAEVRYSIEEYACTAIDVIARRMRLSFLNVQVADEISEKIINIMSEELNWCENEKQNQLRTCSKFLRQEMGICTQKLTSRIPIDLDVTDVEVLIELFKRMDDCRIGYVNVYDLRNLLKNCGDYSSQLKFDNVLKKIDVSQNGQLNLDQYLQIMSGIKHEDTDSQIYFKVDIITKNTPDRSCGGL